MAELKIEFHPSRFAYAIYYVFAVILAFASAKTSLVVLLIAILLVLFAEILRSCEKLSIEEKGISKEFTLAGGRKTYADYEKIQDISVSQGMIDKIFGIGKVKINTASSSREEMAINGVSDPYKVETLIRAKMDSSAKASGF